MKWLSRKLALAGVGLALYSIIPVAFKHFEVSDTITLASLGGITLITGYYFKVNKDLKASEFVDGSN
jgi:hypothetical protein